MRKRLVMILASTALLFGVGAGIAIAGNGSWTTNEPNSTTMTMEYYVNSYTATQTYPSLIETTANCYVEGSGYDMAVHAGFMENGVMIDSGVVKTRVAKGYYNLSWNRGSSGAFALTTFVVCMKYSD